MGEDYGWTAPVVRYWTSLRNFLTHYVPTPTTPRSVITSALMLLAIVIVLVSPTSQNARGMQPVSLSLKLSDTRVYEPHMRARLGTTVHFCEVVISASGLRTLSRQKMRATSSLADPLLSTGYPKPLFPQVVSSRSNRL